MIAGPWLWPVSGWYITARITWRNKAAQPMVSKKEREKEEGPSSPLGTAVMKLSEIVTTLYWHHRLGTKLSKHGPSGDIQFQTMGLVSKDS